MKQALLIVTFGTSVPEARASIDAVEQTLKQTAPELDFFRAFTSPTIRRILAKRGEVIPSLPEALEQLVADGYTHVLVQPTHLLFGIEYDKIRAAVGQYAPKFARLALGKPLLADSEDLNRLAQCVAQQYPAQEGEALVLMGHGTEHFANAVYPALQTAFGLLGREDIFVGTVEGWPQIGDIKIQLMLRGLEQAHLVPLMLVAGDHAKNDMAGDEPDSWKNQLEADGISVRCTLQGLGMLPDVQALYGEHLRELL